MAKEVSGLSKDTWFARAASALKLVDYSGPRSPVACMSLSRFLAALGPTPFFNFVETAFTISMVFVSQAGP